MESKDIRDLRNIGIMAHIDAGKTTTTERILYYTGLTHKVGEVHNGNTVMDWMEQEQQRGITITSAATTCFWHEHRINIIDTPGHVDFTVEVERCLRILDGAIFLLDAKAGVETQTKVVWRQANHYDVPRLVFINKMDAVGAEFEHSVESLRSELSDNPMPIQIPMGSERDFEGVISLITMKAYYNKSDFGETVVEAPIPDAYLEVATLKRKQMIETIADGHDDILMLYLEGEDIPQDVLIEAIKEATLSRRVTPVLCGSAFKNMGVQMLLDAVVDFLPSPLERPLITGHSNKGEELHRKPDDQEPFCGLVFKVMSDPYVGRLAYLRVYSGVIKTGGSILNVSQNKKVRANKLLHMHANNRTEVDTAGAGDIVAAIGLKFAATGNTLSEISHPILLEAIEFPEPVISIAVEPKKSGEYDKMYEALNALSLEDPTLVTVVDEKTGQTILSGMGELHLEIMIDRLMKEFGVMVNSGKPRVTYKETISKEVVTSYELSQDSGPQNTYAYVKLKVSPAERGKGHSIRVTAETKKIPKQYVDAALEGISQSLVSGILQGYEVIDLNIDLCDIQYQEGNATELGFMTAGAYTLKQALAEGTSKLLEPMVSVIIHAPENYIGDIMDDLQKRSGNITQMESYHKDHKLTAIVPLSHMFGYATDIRSLTRGNGHYTMVFSHYDIID